MASAFLLTLPVSEAMRACSTAKLLSGGGSTRHDLGLRFEVVDGAYGFEPLAGE
jgi:hypothetical protein